MNIGTNTEIGSYAYTHKGQLDYKFLGKTGIYYLQQVNYDYEANGLLKKINSNALSSSNQVLGICTPFPSPSVPYSWDYNGKDLFKLELYYNTSMSGISNTPQYNGNISGMKWQVKGRKQQAYTFDYDTYDRLTAANYYDQNSNNSYTATGKFDIDLTYADERGNIQSLDRQGLYHNGGTCWSKTQIDDLSYTYYPNSNRIQQINDGITNGNGVRGFKDGGTGDYLYDSNGNMYYDPNKALTITYNHLNLPEEFNFGNNDRIEVLYDAAGAKLQQKVYDNNVLISTKDYIGGVEYQDGQIESTYHAEGRVFFTSNTIYRHEYAIKDHLGNIRLWVSDLNGNGILETPSEILQEKHYYPFGMAMEGPWMQSGVNNKYQYNGKELNEEFGLDLMDYGARWYDAAVGRWWSVDPLAEKFYSWSSYNYVYDNPLSFIDPDGRSPSTHTNKDGNVLAVYNDGDLGVYKHGDATTQDDIDKKRKRSGTTGGGGKLMGETNYWWDFAKIDTRSDIVYEKPADGAKIYFDGVLDKYIENLYNKALEEMPFSMDPSAAARWLAKQAANGQPLDIKVDIGASNGFLFQGKYVSGRALGNHLFGAVLRTTKPWYLNSRAWFSSTMKIVGAYNKSQNETTFSTPKPFYGENRISGNYIARGYWGNDWSKKGNYAYKKGFDY